MKKIIRHVAALVIGLGVGGIALAGLETVTHISDLNASWPLGSDLASTSDDHIRNIKTALKTDFPTINAAVTATPTQLNQLTGLSTVQGDILYASASNTLTNLAKNTSATRYLSNTGTSNNPAWAQINLGNGVTGNLSSSNLDLTMAPTMTGQWIFSGNPVQVNNNAKNALAINSSGTNFGTIQNDAADTWSLGTTTAVGTLGTSVLKWVKAGNVTIAAPSSGSSVTIGVVDNTNTLVMNDASATSGFGVAFQHGGTGRGFIGTGSATFTGAALTDFGIASASNLLFSKDSGATTSMKITTGGAIQGFGATASALVDMTPDTGTFTATYTGFTAGVTCTATWSRIGKLVLLFFCSATGTSNATSFTMTGLPSAIQPSSLTQTVPLPIGPVQNASIIDTTVSVTVTTGSGTVTFLHNGNSSGWTNSGTKGFSSGATISYLLN